MGELDDDPFNLPIQRGVSTGTLFAFFDIVVLAG